LDGSAADSADALHGTLADGANTSTDPLADVDYALAERLGSTKDALQAASLGARDLGLLLRRRLGVKALSVSG
jgi:hypothetical protein